jgi:BolA family transcriptional regulator, general stress-responsive regulator
MDAVEKLIEDAIRSGLDPLYFEIADESSLHAGHAGAQPGGETHYRIMVVSERFTGLSRVARQQAVYALLVDGFAKGLHALSMQTLTPAEYERQ